VPLLHCGNGTGWGQGLLMEIDAGEEGAQLVERMPEPGVGYIERFVAGDSRDDDGEHLLVGEFAASMTAEFPDEAPKVHTETAILFQFLEEGGEMVRGSRRYVMHVIEGAKLPDVELEVFRFFYTARGRQYHLLFDAGRRVCGQLIVVLGIEPRIS
jgi:hypothetical protein